MTSEAFGYETYLSTSASTFTLGALKHFTARQSTIGAGSTVTNQFGFLADSTLVSATNNYGFYSNIPSGTNRYNFYAAGSATNYMAGRLGLSTSYSTVGFTNALNITGSNYAWGNYSNGTIQSDVTTSAFGYQTNLKTAATSFTIENIYHYGASQGTFGAGSFVTNQYGFIIGTSCIGATNNYGFYSMMPSGTGRWNFYAEGTARNYFAGGIEVAAGSTTMTSGFTHIPAGAGAPTGAPTNPTGNVPLYCDTTNSRLYIYNGSAWKYVTLT